MLIMVETKINTLRVRWKCCEFDFHWSHCVVLLSKTFYPLLHTVNLEIFARTLLSRNFAYAKFRENKPLTK